MNDFSSVNIFKRSFNFLIGCSKPDGASSITYWGSQENWWFRTAYVDGCIKINSCPEDFVFKFFNAMSWGRNWKFLSQTFTICLGISKGHRVGSDFSFHWVWFEILKMSNDMIHMIWFIWYKFYLIGIPPFKFSHVLFGHSLVHDPVTTLTSIFLYACGLSDSPALNFVISS